MTNLSLLEKIRDFIKLGLRRRAKEGGKEIKMEEGEKPPSFTGKMYLKALTIHSPEEMEKIRDEIKSGNILIIKIEPLVKKSVEEAKRVVNEMSEFAASVGGDIARLGEERIILTPPGVQIWREKPSDPSTKI